jgi:hemerythrin-like domain-containing protein
MTLKCIEVLTTEHKTMLRITDVLDSMSKQARDHGDYATADVEAVVDILRRFGDQHHQAKEEGALFPIFTGSCDPTEYAAVRHMFFEHEQDRALMSGIQDSIARYSAPHFAEYASRLATVLRNHIFKEDNILFETINDHLSAEDDARVMSEFESFDQTFYPQQKHLHDQLRRLEWKYLRKIA